MFVSHSYPVDNSSVWLEQKYSKIDILNDYVQGINFLSGNVKKMYIHDPSRSNSSLWPNRTKPFLLGALICLHIMALVST